MAGLLSTPLPAVRVAWRPEELNRVTNPGFETDTTGWATTAGINAAGTSITRVTTDSRSGSASASVVCGATFGSGVNWDFGSARFFPEASHGAVYVATGWIRRASGSRRARVILGSEGTPADRATLVLRDLPDAWVPFRVAWLPTAARTDVQLAVTNGSAQAITFRLDDVSVSLLPGFTQVENGSFETDTTGWAGSGSGTIARSTSEHFGGSACARITATASADDGAVFAMPARTWTAYRTYRLRFAAKKVSGNDAWRAELYDPDGTVSLVSAPFTAPLAFTWFTVDWTVGGGEDDPGDFTGAVDIRIIHPGASEAVVAIDEVEVYEAIDDLGTDAGDLAWSRSLGSVGTATIVLDNSSGDYDPRNSSSPLQGLVTPGRRVLIRSRYGSGLHGSFCGTVTTVEPRPWEGRADLVCEDMLGYLARATVSVPFIKGATYADIRGRVLASALAGTTSLAPSASGRLSITSGLEDSTFFAATDGDVGVLDLFTELDEATQSVHWAQPSPHAAVGWRCVVEDRATLTADAFDVTVDDDSDPVTDITGVRLSHDALENHQEVPWQSFEPLVPLHPDETGSGVLMIARLPSVWDDNDADDPYLHYTKDAFGTDDDHPEMRWRYPHGMTRRQWVRRRKRGLKVKRRTRVFPDAFLPISTPLGWLERYTLDFAVPVADVAIAAWNSTPTLVTSIETDFLERRPNRVIVDVYDTPSVVSNPPPRLSRFEVTGVPYRPTDDLEAVADAYDSQAAHGFRAGPGLGTSYIPSAGAAEGVGAYRNWRWGTPRLTPTVVDHNRFPQTLTADLTDHVTVTATRWSLSGVEFVATGARWTVTTGGLDWTRELDLEELPMHTPWLVLDDADAGLDDAVVLAY